VSIEKIKKQIEKLSPDEEQQLLSDILEKFKEEVFKNPGWELDLHFAREHGEDVEKKAMGKGPNALWYKVVWSMIGK
jgi:hypothetical protein